MNIFTLGKIKEGDLFKTRAVVKRKAVFSMVLMLIVFLMTGCAAIGPRHVPQDRFGYNEALAESSRHQMLLNLVRLQQPIRTIVSKRNASGMAGGVVLG